MNRRLQRLLTRTLARRYTVKPDMVYMDASQPITPADVAIMHMISMTKR